MRLPVRPQSKKCRLTTEGTESTVFDPEAQTRREEITEKFILKFGNYELRFAIFIWYSGIFSVTFSLRV